MMDVLFLVRVVHVIAGVGWLGEVTTINFVLLPALFKAQAEDRVVLLNTVFPYVFRLATILGGAAVASGLALVLWYTRLDVFSLTQGQWGWSILVGGLLGALLYVFHIFQESGAERSLAAYLTFTIDTDDPKSVQAILNRLAIFPRAGMAVLVIVIGLMVAAAHFI
jgi:hypothetical protein